MAQTYEDKPTLAAWNEVVGAVSAAPKIATGSYTGDGYYGSAHAITLTFEFEPKAVLIVSTGRPEFGLLIRPGWSLGVSGAGMTNAASVTWDGNSVSWYHGSSEGMMLNSLRTTYYYLAIC